MSLSVQKVQQGNNVLHGYENLDSTKNTVLTLLITNMITLGERAGDPWGDSMCILVRQSEYSHLK